MLHHKTIYAFVAIAFISQNQKFGCYLQLAALFISINKPPARRFVGLFWCTLGIIRQFVIIGTAGQPILLLLRRLLMAVLLLNLNYWLLG
jgi:hypothetical protein